MAWIGQRPGALRRRWRGSSGDPGQALGGKGVRPPAARLSDAARSRRDGPAERMPGARREAGLGIPASGRTAAA